MKIRNGFVSNSSSSSFIVHIKKDVFDKEFEKLPKNEKETIKILFKEDNVLGMKTMTHSTWNSAGDDKWSNYELPEDHWEIKYYFLEKFLKEEKYEHNEDW